MIDLDISKAHMEGLYKDFGPDSKVHCDLLIEEMSELMKELCKYDRIWRSQGERLDYASISYAKDHIAEEMAHVYICLEAVKHTLLISNSEIQKEIYRKEEQNGKHQH